MPNNDPTSLKRLFLLESDVIFLNHGSFGATPIPVLETQQAWQRKLESQPVRFLQRDVFDHLRVAREALGTTLNAPAESLAFVPNATVGVNTIARSLGLKPGDEILTSDHEYGACLNVWQSVCQKSGAHLICQPISCPVESEEAVIDQLWQAVSERTRVLFLSHITSPTSLILPVETLCQKAHEAGLLCIIDGAHGPGYVDLDLQKIGADFYTGNCHKWLCAPKGSGFMYASERLRDSIEPLMISWGWGEDNPFEAGSRYLDMMQWPGTYDPSAYLSVPAAIQFLRDFGWEEVRQRCRDLAAEAVSRICASSGLAPLSDRGSQFNGQMVTIPIPPVEDMKEFKTQLYDDHRIEIPMIEWGGWQYVRLSVQGYNSPGDIDKLESALTT